MIVNTKSVSFFFLPFVLFFSHYAFSQTFNLDNYVVTQFGMDEGLPQSTVNDIVQTQDGYIWLATNGGLVRFDGINFTTFNRSNTPNMRFDRIIKLYEDRQGALWITSESGMLRMKDREFKPYLFSEGSTVFSAREMVEDKNDVIWANVFDKTYRFKEEEFIEVKVSTNPETTRQAISSNEGAWLVRDKKIYKTLGDSLVVVKDLDNVIDSELLNIVEHPANSGVFFIGTINSGIIKYDKGNLSFYNDGNGLPSNNFNAFSVDRSGNLFAFVFGHLALWNGTNFENFQPFYEPNNIQFQSILEDNEGNYWVGTTADGLFKMKESIISMIDGKDGLMNEKMLAIMKLKDGSGLFSTNCGGIYKWEDGNISIPDLDFISGDGCFWSMFEDSKGRFWFGARGVYLTNSLSEKGTFLGVEEGFTNDEIFAITEDSKGNIWIASSGVLTVYNEGILKRFTTEDGMYYSDARTLFEDEDGTMWVGTVFGLHTIKDNKVEKFELIDYEQDDLNFRQPYIRAIYKDTDGVMWIGTYGNGIFRIEDGRIDNITTAQGLFDNVVSHIVEDQQGNFWMGSNRGISSVSKADLNAVVSGLISEVRSYSYGTESGMNSAETNGGFQPSAFIDSLGQIYFPTVAGVAVVATNDVEVSETPPPVYIESIRTNEGVLAENQTIQLPYNSPYLQFQYTAINFTNPKKVEFKHRVKGLSDDWIRAGNNREATYSRIPPGEYIFEVAARNNTGDWNYEGASVKIIITPPFWQTAWFYTLLAFLFIAIIMSVYFYLMDKVKRENERKKMFTDQLIISQENERRRIASELHDGLGQQILVIKNRVELAKSKLDKPDELNEQLTEIMKSASSSIDDVRSISHALRPIHLEKFGLTEAVKTLCTQLITSTTIEWSYHIDDIDDAFEKNKEINFFRVLQEATNNIIKHAEATEASLMVMREQNEIKMVLWDNGKGFDIKQKSSFLGLGLSGMKERMITLGGSIDIQSTEGSGTVIKTHIPVFQNV